MNPPTENTPLRGHTGYSIGLYDIGSCGPCCYSWFCFPCAIGSTRTALDGSSCLLNSLLLHPVPLRLYRYDIIIIISLISLFRWLVRTSYNIPVTSPTCMERYCCCCCSCCNCFNCDNCWDDFLTAIFCPCCSVNQLYQTTLHRGNPFPNKGRMYNSNPFLVNSPTCEFFSCDIFKSFFCIPCLIGDILHETISMPWYMACFMVHPCMMRNFYRYQYRIEGDDECHELCCPLLQCQISPIHPIQYVSWILYSCMMLQILQDSRMRRIYQEVENLLIERDQAHSVLPSAPIIATYIDSNYVEIIR